MALGATVVDEDRVAFRVWAPERRSIEVVLGEGRSHALSAEAGGYWSGQVSGVGAGARYRYRLDGGECLPDPCSRYQPEGPHGPSEVVDPSRYRWRDQAWRGLSPAGHVIYELHIGTFTQAGTWDAARERLAHLRELGVTTLELMPVPEFPGRFGWGYDGVDLFAPYHHYGRPDDFRRFVDEAHGLGLAVLLDVVYNHLGPDGNYLRAFSPRYFSVQKTEWGDALNFDGEGSAGTRTFVLENAAYWIREFHLDGLRFDATQSIFDRSPEHILAELARHTRQAAGDRALLLVAENEPQDTTLVRPRVERGHALDALWNDDFHHSAVVAATGRSQAYYGDTLGSPQELISAVKRGYLYQGQRYEWQQKARGSSSAGLAPHTFVAFLENHDQVANSSTGERLWQLTSPGRFRALTALLLLAPWTPMLFQGQEWGASQPFLYFAAHQPELAALVKKGRGEFLKQFPSYASDEVQAQLDDPASEATFQRSKLIWSELEHSERARQTLMLHRDLLALRRTDRVLALREQPHVDGAVLGPESFALRFFDPRGHDRLLLINLGRDLRLVPAPEPLLAPVAGHPWRARWSSEARRYGGVGSPELHPAEAGFYLMGHAAVLLLPEGEESDAQHH